MQAPLQPKNDAVSVEGTTARRTTQERSLVDNRPAAVAQRQLAELMHSGPRMVAQRQARNALFGETIQRQQGGATPARLSPAQHAEKPNNAGLPATLKSGIESLSGMRMDHVKVHYNSGKPAQMQAHAYAQGSDIHLGPGQEKHLPHEAWHVVQQAQGRVRPTLQMKAGAVNDDPALEQEADRMGAKAAQFAGGQAAQPLTAGPGAASVVAQRFVGFEYQMLESKVKLAPLEGGQKFQKWEAIQDGSNLELMTTETLSTESDVKQVVGAMAALAKAVEAAKPEETVDAGDKRITVTRGDRAGQPQVNFDLSLAAMGGDFAPPLGKLIGNRKFDAERPAWGWNAADSRENAALILDAVKNAHQRLTDALILNSYYGDAAPEKWPSSLFEDIRGYVVLDFSQQYQRATSDKGLSKDVPLLAKTSLSTLRGRLAGALDEVGSDLDSEKRFARMLEFLAAALVKSLPVEEFRKDIGKSRGISLYDPPHEPLVHKENDRLGILLELRRAPIIPIDEWVPFAMSAFEEVGSLFAPKAKEPKSEPVSSDDEQ